MGTSPPESQASLLESEAPWIPRIEFVVGATLSTVKVNALLEAVVWSLEAVLAVT